MLNQVAFAAEDSFANWTFYFIVNQLFLVLREIERTLTVRIGTLFELAATLDDKKVLFDLFELFEVIGVENLLDLVSFRYLAAFSIGTLDMFEGVGLDLSHEIIMQTLCAITVIAVKTRHLTVWHVTVTN